MGCFECGEEVGHTDGCSRARRFSGGADRKSLIEQAHAERKAEKGSCRQCGAAVGERHKLSCPHWERAKADKAPAASVEDQPQPKQSNFGKTKTCPECGATVGRGLRHNAGCPTRTGGASFLREATIRVGDPQPVQVRSAGPEPAPEPYVPDVPVSPGPTPRVGTIQMPSIEFGPTPTLPGPAQELDAMRGAYRALQGLPDESKRRALRWVEEAFGLATAKGE